MQRLQKGRALPQGTIRTWADGNQYQKQPDGTWSQVAEEGERPARGGTGPETAERRWKKMRAAERALPRLRRQVRKDLAAGPSERACLAGAVVLLDRAAMRVGSETYAQAHGTYGAASLLRKHATVDGSKVRLEFKGKSGVQWRTEVQDAAFARLVGELQAQPLDEDAPLFSYPSLQGYRRINAGRVNEYLKDVSKDRGLSAKGLRTYHASRMLEDKLREEGMPEEPKRREGALRRAVKAVAAKLHHTVAVCRSTYLHPGIIQAYLDGRPEFATLLKAGVGEDGYTAGECRFNALLDALERAGYASGGRLEKGTTGGGNSSSQGVATPVARGVGTQVPTLVTILPSKRVGIPSGPYAYGATEKAIRNGGIGVGPEYLNKISYLR